ncbi:DUF2911 domain-containing protein [Mucilaginibacter sp.]|uniref:DUF2911 domain-containing protein n=1 Tax=Mucilaginibacter sp. TaxID=1882438 RepID=UPI00261E83C8|nr:DUF2911 domain-containing protein [Mucilaginibacter sp.]MDB5031735.1 hypothetical protein [Mucilaginibacter sp.]
MKKVFQLRAMVFLAFALLVSTIGFAQNKAKVIASPRDSVSGKVHGATITINYGSPSVKGRKIFGGLEPYGKVWRAGANEATTFTTDKDIMVEGKKLPAGKYDLFATPGEKEWKVIFNSKHASWGIKGAPGGGHVASDDPATDVLVATVTPKTVELTERLKYVITSKGFELVWENVSVPVSIK